jgi:signal transduction histidine kinase
MKSLRKTIQLRFTALVLFYSLLILLAVYGMTLWNMYKSAQWELNRFEQRIVKRLGSEGVSKLNEDNLILSVGEESRYSFVVKFRNGETFQSGPFKDELTRRFLNKKRGFEFINHKAFSVVQFYEGDEFTLASSMSVSLDLIDDNLWIFIAVLILILFPTFFFSYRMFKQLMKPLEIVSETLNQVSLGKLNSRAELPAEYFEIETLIQRLNETLENLEGLFRQSESFNAHAAHELKTPLTIMKGEIDLCLFKKRSVEEYEDCLTKNVEELHRLNSIIESLLLISSPGREWQKSFEDIDLSGCIEYDLIEVLALEKGIVLTYDLDSFYFLCSSQLMKQAFFNLIENAVKYSPENGEVVVRLKVERGSFSFSIEDSAEALSAEQRKLVLQPFYRISRVALGSGLGLSIVQWIAQLHGCNLRIQTTAKGNCFTISQKPSFKG